MLRIAEEADYEAFSLVAVPTSTAGERPIIADSIAQIIENIQGGRLSKKAFHDCSDVLTRVQTIPKSHLCPPELRPDEYNHYMTIECRIGNRRIYGIAAVDSDEGEKCILDAIIDVSEDRKTAERLADRYNRELVRMNQFRTFTACFVNEQG